MSGGNENCGSYEETYGSQYRKIYLYIRRNIHNDDMAVEDLVQDVFLVAYQQWETVVRDHPNIPGYLMTIAQNKIKKWYEKQSRIYLNDSELLDVMVQKERAGGGIDPYEMAEFYTSAEKTLSKKEVHLLRCYYEYGYKASELSEEMGVTESCFKIRIARMKEKLRKSMNTMLLLAISIVVNEIFCL